MTVAAGIAAACTRVRHEHIHTAAEPLARPEAGESVTAVLYYYEGISAEDARAMERAVTGCIADALAQAVPVLRFIEPDDFRRIAFPGLSAAETPSSPESLTILLSDPQFRERIRPLRIRYLVIVSGGTRQSSSLFVGCAGGYPGAACLAFYVWDRHSNLGALILDVANVRVSERVRTEASGAPGFAVIGILPIAWPAFTKRAACAEFGRAVAESLLGVDANPPPERR